MTEEMSLTVFDPIKADLAALDEKDANLVFDHTTEDGEKSLRSYVALLRGHKGHLKRIKDDAKRDALDYGKKVQGIFNELTAGVQKIINARMKPLDEIEDAKRAAAEAQIEAEMVESERVDAERLADLKKREDKVALKEVQQKAAEDAANAEQQEAKRVEWGRGIAARATETATKLAEANAAREALALKKSIAATEAASQAKKDRLAEAERKRVADQDHRAKVEDEIRHAIDMVGGQACDIEAILEALKDGKIPHVTINY